MTAWNTKRRWASCSRTRRNEAGEIKMKMFVVRNMLLTAALVAAPLASEAFAHGSMKPLHGGQVALAGETVIELVRSAHGVTVYLSDEDQPVPAAGMTGKLIITQSGKKSDVP